LVLPNTIAVAIFDENPPVLGQHSRPAIIMPDTTPTFLDEEGTTRVRREHVEAHGLVFCNEIKCWRRPNEDVPIYPFHIVKGAEVA